VRQVGYLLELHRDALSPEYKIPPEIETYHSRDCVKVYPPFTLYIVLECKFY